MLKELIGSAVLVIVGVILIAGSGETASQESVEGHRINFRLRIDIDGSHYCVVGSCVTSGAKDSEPLSKFADSHLQEAVVGKRIAVKSALPSPRPKGSPNASR
jgi:hypothetical protein